MICNNCGNAVDSIHRFCPKCGAPIQQQAPPPPPSGSPYNPPPYSPPPPLMGGPPPLPPKQSSGCGKMVLIAVIILALIGAGIAAAIYYGFKYTEKTLKSSEAYTLAVKVLKENEEVREKLGEINDTGFPIGAFSQNSDGSGQAAFVMSVEGTKGKGQYQVELSRTDSVWHVKKAIVKTADGETIQVVDSRRAPEELPSPDINTSPDSTDLTPKDAIRGGDLTAKATSLPKPAYPAIAKQAKAVGQVVVRVLVDENGNVIGARAIMGHPLLQAVSVAAARSAKFTPTKVAGKPVKVSGTITYRFTGE
jgi:TonB family protein